MMSEGLQIFSDVFVSCSLEEQNKSILIHNSCGKYWLLPRFDMRTGLSLYQPSGIKGKTMKSLLPFVFRFPFVLPFLKAERVSLRMKPEFHELVERIFSVKDYQVSAFSGTPGIHRKITLQISTGGNILGYLKCTPSDEISSLFLHEEKVLDVLNKSPIRGRIPRCLFCGTLAGGVHVFLQSTIKTADSSVLHEWTPLHEQFQEDMASNCFRAVLFEETDFYASINRLTGYLSAFSESERVLLEHAIQRVMEHWNGSDVVFSPCHGDFTPWNMFEEKGNLFVFDFEYAGMSYPPMMDRFHFIVQTGIFEKHYGAEEIFRDYVEWRKSCDEDTELTDLHFLCYLLDIVSRFICRGKGVMEQEVRGCSDIWFSLMGKL